VINKGNKYGLDDWMSGFSWKIYGKYMGTAW
jgi:hypothetical protein